MAGAANNHFKVTLWLIKQVTEIANIETDHAHSHYTADSPINPCMSLHSSKKLEHLEKAHVAKVEHARINIHKAASPILIR